MHGEADLHFQDFLRAVFGMPPRSQNDDIPPPYEYMYFLTRIRTAVSLALARGIAEKVHKQRKHFTRAVTVPHRASTVPVVA